MEFMIDTANIEEIKTWSQILPLNGVTSNPSILKKEGQIDFFKHIKKIREIVGNQSKIHVQVVADTYDGIIKDAYKLRDEFGMDIYVKIPVTNCGIRAIKTLKAEGFKITATAIYTIFQGYLAIEAGADYLAPYYNRMENLNINPIEVINQLAKAIEKQQAKTKILAASFKNVSQLTSAIMAGADAVTASIDIYESGFMFPSIQKAVDDFLNDWKDCQGRNCI